MRNETIELLETSFAEVAQVRDVAASLFYQNLFERDPRLRPMFANADMAEQGRKLMGALAVVISGLRRPEAVLPALRALAVKHVGYGVRDEHYATVGAALIDTLAAFFGSRFKPDMRQAWTDAYGFVSSAMIAAAQEAAAGPTPARAA